MKLNRTDIDTLRLVESMQTLELRENDLLVIKLSNEVSLERTKPL